MVDSYSVNLSIRSFVWSLSLLLLLLRLCRPQSILHGEEEDDASNSSNMDANGHHTACDVLGGNQNARWFMHEIQWISSTS
jgi:hypothetical protein